MVASKGLMLWSAAMVGGLLLLQDLWSWISLCCCWVWGVGSVISRACALRSTRFAFDVSLRCCTTCIYHATLPLLSTCLPLQMYDLVEKGQNQCDHVPLRCKLQEVASEWKLLYLQERIHQQILGRVKKICSERLPCNLRTCRERQQGSNKCC